MTTCVLAGDNLFSKSLARSARSPGEGRAGDRRLRRRRPRGDPPLQRDRLDEDDHLTYFEEKPEHPRTRSTGIALYFYPRTSLGVVRDT